MAVEESKRAAGGERMIDAAILTLCLLACMAAECVPLLLPLVATAGVLAGTKERPPRVLRTLRAARRNGKVTNLTVSPPMITEKMEDFKYE